MLDRLLSGYLAWFTLWLLAMVVIIAAAGLYRRWRGPLDPPDDEG